MRDSNFNYKLEVLQQWVYELQGRAEKDPAHLEKVLPEVFEELYIRLGKLLAADEELRQWNEELTAAQRVVEAERQHYRGLFDFAPDGYLVTNASGVIQEANRAAAALFSVPQGLLLGIPLIAFVTKEDCRAVFTQLDRLKELERVQDWEVYLKPHKGMPFPSTITVATVRDPQGRLIGHRWLIRDITEHKRMEEALRKAHNELEIGVQERTAELVKANEALQAEIIGRKLIEGALGESEEQYRHLFENVPTGIYRTTPDGHILIANPALIHMLGYSSFNELASRNIEKEDFYVDYPRSQFRELLEQEGEIRGLESKWIKHDGTMIFVRENAKVIRGEDGIVLYYEGTVEDITERKRVEEVLKENLAQLSKKNRYETIISIVTRSVHQSINLQDVLENSVEAMSKNIDGADNVSIYLVEGEEAVLKVHRGYPDWWAKRVGKISYPKGFTWKTIIEGKPMYCGDVDQDTAIGPAGREMGTKSYVSMPIHHEGKTVGCININSLKKNAFSEEELNLLEIVAQQIEMAINNAQQAGLLRQSKEELEIRVQERTQKLSETNEELKKEIAWRKQAEKALRNSEEQYRALYEYNPSMYFTVDKEGKILSVNQFGAEQIGYTAEELIGQSVLEIVYGEDKKTVLEKLTKCLQNSRSKRVFQWESRKVQNGGGILWVRESARAVRKADGSTVVLIVCEDITERKRAEEQLKASLKEKEVLLKEIHHRVKNNLQVISSLLRLQSEYINEKQTIEMLNETQNRVQSMALIHEILYQSKDLSRISFGEYIQNLITHLFQSYGIKSDGIALRINVNNISLGVDTAISCGLIINELVSNSLKHAFFRRKKGRIHIELHPYNGAGDSTSSPYALIVSDNGVGFPMDLDFRNTESLGLQLVISLVKKLKGNIELDRTNGTAFKIVFHP